MPDHYENVAAMELKRQPSANNVVEEANDGKEDSVGLRDDADESDVNSAASSVPNPLSEIDSDLHSIADPTTPEVTPCLAARKLAGIKIPFTLPFIKQVPAGMT